MYQEKNHNTVYNKYHRTNQRFYTLYCRITLNKERKQFNPGLRKIHILGKQTSKSNNPLEPNHQI
jgi:hypothetical protein